MGLQALHIHGQWVIGLHASWRGIDHDVLALDRRKARRNALRGQSLESGDECIAAHKVGIEFVRKSAMQRVKSPFEIVVTTNSGYPLDMNLYQGVKGMSAAARIVRPGGIIILACECSEGVPANSPLDKLLRSARSSEEILLMLATPGFVRPEQWQAQIQALIQRKAEVLVYSKLSDEVLASAHLKPCRDIGAEVAARLASLGPEARVAVLPQGPLTIPYLA